MSLAFPRIIRAAPTVAPSGQLAVRLDLGEPSRQVGITPAHARVLARQLLTAARVAEGVEGVVAGGRDTPPGFGSS